LTKGAAGESGELVVTSLVNRAMPLIRYRIGDRASWPTADSACGCGRTLPLLEGVEGRALDRLVDTRRRPVHAEMIDYAFRANGGLRLAIQFRVVQRAADSLEIYVVPGPSS
jgi:phenylacetate-CoA ligase